MEFQSQAALRTEMDMARRRCVMRHDIPLFHVWRRSSPTATARAIWRTIAQTVLALHLLLRWVTLGGLRESNIALRWRSLSIEMKSEMAYVLQSLEFSMGNDNDNSIQLCFF